MSFSVFLQGNDWNSWYLTCLMSRTRESQRGSLCNSFHFILSGFLCERKSALYRRHSERHLLHSGFCLLPFYTRMAPDSYSWQKSYPSLARRLLILLMPPSGSGAQSFSLLTNKLVFVFEWLHPSSLFPPAAGEAGRKFSMKQRRHAARWLMSGAQGHWC